MDFAGPMDLFCYDNRGPYLDTDALRREGPIVWNSRDHAQPRELFYGNFMPCVFLGNGDRAFTWVCETDRGMRLLKDRPAMQLERSENGEYSLRIFFVNEPGPVESPRHVRFALQTLPSKPEAADRRRIGWFPEDLCGAPMMADGSASSSIHLIHEEDYALFKPKPIEGRSYTRAVDTCFDLPGYKELCYTGEWTRRTLQRARPIAPPPGQPRPRIHPVTLRRNDSIYLQSVGNWDWCQSKVDCAAYWRGRQIRLGRQQGWWWDLSLCGDRDFDQVVGNAYLLPPEKAHMGGRIQYGFHWFLPRQHFMRLARIISQAGLTNKSHHYGGFASAYLSPFLRDEANWEGAAGYAGTLGHLRRYGMDFMRFSACNYAGLSGVIVDDVNWRILAGADPMPDRSNLAHALLHDIGSLPSRLAYAAIHSNVVSVLEAFGYFRGPAVVEFIPYWRSRSHYRYGRMPSAEAETAFLSPEEKEEAARLDEVYVTIYRSAGSQRALLVLANNADQPVSEILWVGDSLLGRPARRCRDAETGEDIRSAPDPKDPRTLGSGLRSARGIPNTFSHIFIAPLQFRLLLIE
jgi:hypothetical protein